MDDYRGRVGFAIGTGIVPGVMGFLVIAVTTSRPPIAFVVGLVVWAIVSFAYWYRSGRAPGRRP